MSRMRIVVLAALLLGVVPAPAQDVSPALPPADSPSSIDEGPPAPPIALRHEDAATFLHSVPPTEVTPPPAAGDVTIRLPAEAPRPQNPSSHFVFTDATDRTAPRVKTLAERRAAVEAIRRSLRGAGGVR